MFDSIFFNDSRLKAISKFKEIKNDLSFSVADMNEKKNIEKIKDLYEKDSVTDLIFSPFSSKK